MIRNQIINLPFNIHDINADKLFFCYSLNNEDKRLIISLEYVKKNNFIRIDEQEYKEAKNLYFEVHDKETINRYYLGEQSKNTSESIKFNKGIFEDLDSERTNYLGLIDSLIEETNKLKYEVIKTNKNLIFFSVYFNNGYIELFDLCLKSLHYHKFKNYDILIITDEPTRKVINQLNILNFFNVNFLITDEAVDSSDASMKKCLLYKFDRIFDYEKIFLLDVDIMCVKNAEILFNIPICENQIYAARQTKFTSEDFRKKYHGFSCISDSFIKQVEKTDQMPFNAGQFLFLNTSRMKVHFDNINKFMREWTGNYFYEQCFLNYYFCKANMAMSKEMDRFVALVSPHHEKVRYNLTTDTRLIHFIGPSGNAEVKIKAVEKFLNKNYYASLFKA